MCAVLSRTGRTKAGRTWKSKVPEACACTAHIHADHQSNGASLPARWARVLDLPVYRAVGLSNASSCTPARRNDFPVHGARQLLTVLSC